MFLRKIQSLFLYVSMGVLVGSCSKWDDHNALNDAQLGKDLMQQVNEDPNLSRFAELVVKSGYDGVLRASKTFTVWAPTNAALQNLDPALVNDTARLRRFVGNHVASQMYSTGMAVNTMRIGMLNGKYLNLKGNLFDSATITDGNHYAKNGILHVVDKMVPVLSNSWETLTTQASVPARQRDFMLSLVRTVFDATNAVQIGVDTSGRPIYQPGTDSIRTNLFWRNVQDLRNEARQYTLFVMADGGWDAEVNKFKPYFATGTTDSTNNLAGYEVVKDLAFDTVYASLAAMPDTLTSRSGVRVGVPKQAVTQTIRTSNGVIYVVNSMPVTPAGKLREIRIEGENYRATSNDRRGNTYFRDKINPLTGAMFRDVLVINHGISQFWMNYRVGSAYSVKYRVYWVALNDFQTATHQQRLAIGTTTNTTMPLTAVVPNTYTEQYVGEFTLSAFAPNLDVFLTAANSTAQAVNPLVCDYIRLVPAP